MNKKKLKLITTYINSYQHFRNISLTQDELICRDDPCEWCEIYKLCTHTAYSDMVLTKSDIQEVTTLFPEVFI